MWDEKQVTPDTSHWYPRGKGGRRKEGLRETWQGKDKEVQVEADYNFKGTVFVLSYNRVTYLGLSSRCVLLWQPWCIYKCEWRVEATSGRVEGDGEAMFSFSGNTSMVESICW